MERDAPQVAAVLLAAGASRRFGRTSKLLADINGEPLIRRVARTVLESGVMDIVVVTGAEPAPIEAALAGLPLRVAHNADWAVGMGGSIATGARTLSSGVAGAFIVPGDMPFLSAELIRRLVAAFARSGERAIIYPATLDGEQRNPVLWPRRFFPRLQSFKGDECGKPLLESARNETVAVTVDDESLFADIDTRADLAAALRRSA